MLPARLERIAWMPVTDNSTPKYTSWSGAVRWRTALAKLRSISVSATPSPSGSASVKGSSGGQGSRVWGAVVGGGGPGPPVAPVGDHLHQVGRLVQVLGLGVAELADVAGHIAAAHLAGEGQIGVVLGEHVDAGRPFGRLGQG